VSRIRWLIPAVALVAIVGVTLPSAADHATRPATPNIQALGHSPHEGHITGVPGLLQNNQSDIAFWGERAINGNYNGWRVIDISDPASPQEITWFDDCNGNQGDILIWGDTLIRSWNSPAVAGQFCGVDNATDTPIPVPLDFEGIHVFDIHEQLDGAADGNVEATLLGSVETECGSHTATLVPDTDNDRLLVYSNGSGGGCDWTDIIEIQQPLIDQSDINYLRAEPLTAGSQFTLAGCHDQAVILGDVMKSVCASGHSANVFSLGGADGGSLENPRFLYTIEEEDGLGNKVGVNAGNFHSGAFTFDGEVIVLSAEPGGGSAPMCETSDPVIMKSMWFYDADTGQKLGQWTLPRGQDGVGENCTIHNYNMVPLASGRYVLVGGHYQAGTWVVDFTDPANPETVAWTDPPVLSPPELGGAWSTYWYNGYIYESEITKGLNVFQLNDDLVADAIDVPFLNPQTQMESFPKAAPPSCKGRAATVFGTGAAPAPLNGTAGADVIVGTDGGESISAKGGDDVVCAGGGNDKVRGKGGDDLLLGQGGNDRLNGGSGDDKCVGGPGRDRAKKCERGRA
jgi:RTX calcium-binding nonapeptide repeat (4 copies)